MSIKTDSLYIDNFPALHAGLVGSNNWQIPDSGQWVPSVTGEGATGIWNIDIRGMAELVHINEFNPYAGTKCPLIFCSGDATLFKSDDIYISRGNDIKPYLVGVTSNPRTARGVSPGACLLWTDIDNPDGPALCDLNINLASYTSNQGERYALRVPNLVIGSDPPNASNLLTSKQISIAGQSIPIWGGSISAATLRNKLNLSSALRFVGQTASSIDDGGTQYPIIDGAVYTPRLGDVIIQSATGYEYLWTGGAWEQLGSDGSYKIVQDEYTSVNEPTQGSSGNFISNITQDSNGNISVEKKTLESLNLIYPTGQKKVYNGSNLDFSLSLIDNSSSGNYWPLLYGMNYRSNVTGTSFDSVANDKVGIAQYANKIYIQPSTGSLYTNNFYALNKFTTKIDNYTTSELVSRTVSNTNEDGTTTNLYNGELRLYGNNNKYTVLRPGNPTSSIALNLPITSQTLIGTAGNSALAGNFIPAANNKIDLGTSDKKWRNIYATTFNGNLVGIADEAKKVSNSLTINNRGKEITFNGEKSATLIVNRRCSVGRQGAFQTNENAFYTESNQLKSWQKIASTAFQPWYTDREIVFKVSKGLDAHQYSGILRAHLRVNANTALVDKVNKQLIWEYANEGIDPNNFMLTVAADTTNNKIIGEIWINVGDASYGIYHFDVMQEHDRSIDGNVGYSELWTLYNHDGSKEEEWQYFDLNEMSNKTLSVLATIKNNTETATSLQNLTASITELNYMSGVISSVQEQLNSLLPLTGGKVTGITTFDNDIVKTMNGSQPGGQWTNTGSRSQLIVGSKGASSGEITLYHSNGNSVTLQAEAYQSIAAIDLTLPAGESQTLIGTAGSENLTGDLSPAPNTNISLGNTYRPWNAVHATTFYGTRVDADAFYGALYGNATTASSLSGTRNANTILAAPDGSDGNAIFRKLVAADLPIASSTSAGIITTEAQTFAGAKIFQNNNLKIQGDSDHALTLWSYKSGDNNVYGLGVYGDGGNTNYLWLGHNATKQTIQLYAPLVLKDSEKAYGVDDPENVITAPSTGQLYFKLID